MNAALLVLLGSLGGTGICLVIAGLGHGPSHSESAVLSRRAPTRQELNKAGVALAVGLGALVVTRWPMAFPLGTFAVVGFRRLGGHGQGHVIERVEAIASWTEMLRDTLAGAAGLNQALIVTASSCPHAIRDQVGTLARRLSSGVALSVALRGFADDLADPAADVVVATLVMAATERAQRLGELLGALAVSTRDEVAMRQGVEASRSSARTALRTVTGFSFGFLLLMGIFARSYLAPYRTAQGQAVLALVGGLFGLGLWLMSVMAGTPRAPRLLISEVSS